MLGSLQLSKVCLQANSGDFLTDFLLLVTLRDGVYHEDVGYGVSLESLKSVTPWY